MYSLKPWPEEVDALLTGLYEAERCFNRRVFVGGVDQDPVVTLDFEPVDNSKIKILLPHEFEAKFKINFAIKDVFFLEDHGAVEWANFQCVSGLKSECFTITSEGRRIVEYFSQDEGELNQGQIARIQKINNYFNQCEVIINESNLSNSEKNDSEHRIAAARELMKCSVIPWGIIRRLVEPLGLIGALASIVGLIIQTLGG